MVDIRHTLHEEQTNYLTAVEHVHFDEENGILLVFRMVCDANSHLL